MTPAQAGRLVRRALSEDGSVREETAAGLLGVLSRSQLKAMAAALRRELRRRTVLVQVAGEADPVRQAAARRFPGRELDVASDPSLGAGVRVRTGDDVVDASVQGAIRRIITELGGT